MTCKFLRKSSSHAQLSPNRVSTRGHGDRLSAHMAPANKISGQRDAVHQGEKSFNLLHHADISDPAVQLTVASSSAATTTMPLVYSETSCWPQTSSSRNRREKNCNCPRQSAFVGNGPQNGETSGFELPLLVTLGGTWLPSLPLLLPQLPLLLSSMATS